jgi:hypothetical protein
MESICCFQQLPLRRAWKRKDNVTPEAVLKELHPVPRAGVTACRKHVVQHEQHVAAVEPLARLVLDRVEFPVPFFLNVSRISVADNAPPVFSTMPAN